MDRDTLQVLRRQLADKTKELVSNKKLSLNINGTVTQFGLR
jgi:hypothetical protein